MIFLGILDAFPALLYVLNESFIDKIVSADSSFARMIIEKISNLKKAFVKVEEKGTRAELKKLRKAEKLYLDAARKAGDIRLVKLILSHAPELEEGVDASEEIQYNRKKTARYIPYEKVGDEVVRHIKTELKKIYNNEDGVADGIAIEHGSDVYIVDSGRENGNTTFGIRRRRRISDAKLRAEFIRSTNNDAVSKRFVSDELSSRVGNGLGGNSGRNMRRESRTELQTDSRESQDNQGGVLGENADNGRLKFPLKVGGELFKDSEGRTLTPEQAEYFKDSKIRKDYSGSLQARKTCLLEIYQRLV